MIHVVLVLTLCTAPAVATPLRLHAPPSPASPIVTPLFVPTQRHPCFRQPAIVNAGGTLLAFTENRNVSACAPELGISTLDAPPGGLSAPLEVGSMLLRRSVDGGETWLPMQSLLVGNIDFYSVVYDAKSNTVWLMISHSGTTVLSSKDRGANWQTMPSLDREALSRPPITLTGPAVGHGIQVLSNSILLSICCGVAFTRTIYFRHSVLSMGSVAPQIDNTLCTTPCKDAGRLVLPFVCRNSSANGTHSDQGCTTCNSCLVLSDGTSVCCPQETPRVVLDLLCPQPAYGICEQTEARPGSLAQ